jgi:hypothetical protein
MPQPRKMRVLEDVVEARIAFAVLPRRRGPRHLPGRHAGHGLAAEPAVGAEIDVGRRAIPV